MTRLLIAYDSSQAARAGIAMASSLFRRADAAVICVAQPVAVSADLAVLNAGLPDAVLAGDFDELATRIAEAADMIALDGAQLAAAAGLPAEPVPLPGGTPWRALLAEARRRHSDVIVCGTRGEGAADRILLGSTASSLLHHADRPLLLVPVGARVDVAAPILVAYDGSAGARTALRFAAAHLGHRRLVVAHAWSSPVRHTVRGRAVLGAPVATLHDLASDMDGIFGELAAAPAEEGARYARELGLEAEPAAPEARRTWRALLEAAQEADATALLLGARGRGAVAATVLGSVTSALVHAAALPVLIAPEEP